MKPSTASRLGILLALGLLATLSGEAVAQDAAGQASAAPETEAPIGALWVPAAGALYRDQLRIDRFIDELRDMPFTEFLIQVRASADAYYDSKLVPRASGVPERFDPLAALVEGLHQGPNPKKVIAWIDPYHAGNLKDAAPLDARHVLIVHQDWLSLREDRDSADAGGDMFLEPGLPAVQQHLEAVVRELVSNYRVDGLYIDPMSDPSGDGKWGYHPAIVSRWVAMKGLTGAPAADDPQWRAFRAQILTDALGGLASAAHGARPNLPIGVGIATPGDPPADAADFSKSQAFAQTHQDFPRWLALDGLSRFYVKDFRGEESAHAVFDGWLNLALAMGRERKANIVIGVAGAENEALDALAQLRRAAEAGADGLALWHYNQPVRDRGSRELFLGAIGRTVLSADYLRSLAVINRSRVRPIRLPVITKGGSRPTSPTATPPAAGEQLTLPPPPALGEVPEEAATAMTTGTGQLLSARPEGRSGAPSASATDAEAETMAALDRMLGVTSPAATPTALPRPAPTRQDLINELLDDPSFRRSADYRYLWGNERAARELKKKYGNIF
jgi:uncharacterized lipoprotein YddW (UPF0748 family)